MRCLDSYVARPQGVDYDVVAVKGEVRRADEPIVLANPNGWISDDCTRQAFSMAHAALYDRLEFNDTVDTIVPTKPAPLMVAVEDFPWNAGIVATGSQFPITHAIIRDNLQRFRPVS